MTSAPWVTPLTLHDPILTPTIRLVPLEVQHARELYPLADPELFRHSMQNPDKWSVDGFRREFEKVIALPDSVAFAILAIAGPHAGKPIGRTTYMDIKPEHRGLEIGRTWIARPYHGTRVNPEIKYLMLRHAFEFLTPSAIRVQITTSGSNVHSQHAIEKLGATREGVLRDARVMPASSVRPHDVITDWVFYSILAREWPAVRMRLEARLST